MTRMIDAETTRIARDRQQLGFDYLNAIFGWAPADATVFAALKQGDFPASERRRRRNQTRLQRAARRANRRR